MMVVVLPIGAALGARRKWRTDRPESLSRLAFAGAWIGFWTAAAGFIVANPTPPDMGTGAQPRSVERTLADLRDFANVLLGGSPQAPVSSAVAWMARAGTVLLLASLILHWRPRWKAIG
ncbi:hypothetical protein [Terrabacter terrae]|uniref:hypothetical protein n=1 Tax=Terrabacter terrae TaxID=318434 RepID=UPI0031CEA250